jgi:hypothetical protein
MRKIVKYIVLFLAVTTILSSCEKNDPILFKQGDAFVAFPESSGSVNERQTFADKSKGIDTINILVMVTSLESTPVTVNFDFDTVGIPQDQVALEDVAFKLLNEQKVLSFPNGWGYDTIKIATIDDEVFTGNRKVNIVLGSNSAGYKNAVESVYTLTILDEEHPLNIVLGTYQVTGTDAWGGAVNRTIKTEAVEGNLDQVKFKLVDAIGYSACPDMYVYVDVDKENKTFYIKAGQEFASFNACDGPNYGPSKTSGFLGAAGDPQIEDGEYIKATFDDNGTIHMEDWFGVQITSGTNEGLWFTIWSNDIVWTKQ